MTRSAERRAARRDIPTVRLCVSVDPNYTVNILQTGLGSAELRDFHRLLPNHSADMPASIDGFHGLYVEMKNAMLPRTAGSRFVPNRQLGAPG